ncbi:hypothetical protein N656DRAFT_792898 [Canariomyces notabilis]|uniref:DUF7136 domain-containing protein n=1 Tax=Canariomyces notabilis TaxID=2074819 RepID=A0AAN6QCX6_9PEZI|nr:hypothetical protein N656DRAFT_792898 [Canariomyces arenarius]
MHLLSQMAWSAVALAYIGTVGGAADVVEIDLVFPRMNETNAPTDRLPAVFAVQNFEFAQNLRLFIAYMIRNGTNSPCDEPDLVHDFEPGIIVNSTNRAIKFTIEDGGQAVELVAATDNDKSCDEEFGVSINVTDKSMEVPSSRNFDGGTCAVLASSTPTVSPHPCQVQIDSAAAASISASVVADLCASFDPPADCPKDNTARRLAVAGTTWLAAALAAFGYILT